MDQVVEFGIFSTRLSTVTTGQHTMTTIIVGWGQEEKTGQRGSVFSGATDEYAWSRVRCPTDAWLKWSERYTTPRVQIDRFSFQNEHQHNSISYKYLLFLEEWVHYCFTDLLRSSVSLTVKFYNTRKIMHCKNLVIDWKLIQFLKYC